MSAESPEDTSENQEEDKKWSFRKEPAVQFALRGLAISLPPVLTIVILIWVLNGVNNYIIKPTSFMVQWTMAQLVDDSISTNGLQAVTGQPALEYCGTNYLFHQEMAERLNEWSEENLQNGEELSLEKVKELLHSFYPPDIIPAPSNRWKSYVYVPVGKREWAVPYHDYELAAQQVPQSQLPTNTSGVYVLVVADRFFRGWFTLFMIVVLIVALYFLGRFVTARLGRWVVEKFETEVLGRLPIISNVYSSVKQVTDFLFTERSVEYSRVVAIEYPRRGIWSLGLVTGESMISITGAAGEPMVSVLIPSSPMPVTGYTMSVPRSDVVDLNISVDQAFQFCISCGVLVPEQQKVTPETLQAELSKRFSQPGGPISSSSIDVPGLPGEEAKGEKEEGSSSEEGSTPE